MFLNILDEPRQLLLRKLSASLPVTDSYLAGGTALALIFGHRESIDFDWFTPSDFDPGELASRLSEVGEVRVAETRSGTFHGWVDGIQVTWLRYPNPILDEFITSDEVAGLKLASINDLSIMKWAALSDRGSIKDFIDLYKICMSGVSFDSLIPKLPLKFPKANINLYHMIKSLAYFDDAEKEVSPVMIHDISWSEVKAYFTNLQKKLAVEHLK